MRWLAWVPISGSDDTIDHKLANPWAYAGKVHWVPAAAGPQPDGNYATEWGTALCGATVPNGEHVIDFLHGDALKHPRAVRCKRCEAALAKVRKQNRQISNTPGRAADAPTEAFAVQMHEPEVGHYWDIYKTHPDTWARADDRAAVRQVIRLVPEPE